jgi:hypothetical protein
MSKRAFCVVLLAAATSACGGKTALNVTARAVDGGSAPDAPAPRRDAGSDAGPGPRADAGPPSPRCPPGVPLGRGPHCVAALFVTSVTRSSSVCFVDLALRESQTARLEYDCGGGGARLVAPDGRAFSGTFDGSRVEVCFGTEFDWMDDCRWSSAQRITGNVAEGMLEMTYTEAPIAGINCFMPCSAVGDIRVGAGP